MEILASKQERKRLFAFAIESSKLKTLIIQSDFPYKPDSPPEDA